MTKKEREATRTYFRPGFRDILVKLTTMGKSSGRVIDCRQGEREREREKERESEELIKKCNT